MSSCPCTRLRSQEASCVGEAGVRSCWQLQSAASPADCGCAELVLYPVQCLVHYQAQEAPCSPLIPEPGDEVGRGLQNPSWQALPFRGPRLRLKAGKGVAQGYVGSESLEPQHLPAFCAQLRALCPFPRHHKAGWWTKAVCWACYPWPCRRPRAHGSVLRCWSSWHGHWAPSWLAPSGTGDAHLPAWS